jgi:hypothetical protein
MNLELEGQNFNINKKIKYQINDKYIFWIKINDKTDKHCNCTRKKKMHSPNLKIKFTIKKVNK